MEIKTNAMRIIERLKLGYIPHSVGCDEALSGVEMAERLGEDPARVFKTLVTVGRSKKNYVFMIPVAEELDLKKAAAAAGEKSIEMIKSKELLPLTGYVHGGCSPIGMKKQFATFVHVTANDFEHIIFSAGKIGYQVEMSADDLKKAVNFELADIICK